MYIEEKDNYWVMVHFFRIGMIYKEMQEYNKALKYLKKSSSIIKKYFKHSDYKWVNTTDLYVNTNICITNKKLKKYYNKSNINNKYLKINQELVLKREDIFFRADYLINEFYFNLYELLNDKNCLKSSYNKTLKHASYMKPTFKKNYLKLSLPKRIICEYNKVFK